MGERLNILIVEDSSEDTLLLIRSLQRAGFEPIWQRVKTESDFKAALSGKFDLIFADIDLPEFSARRALDLLQEGKRDTPLIIIAETSGADRRFDALFAEAGDVLWKNQFELIGPMVQRALRHSRWKAERRHLEVKLRQAQKMEAIGRVASGVAHDFNNILMAIMVDADLSAREENLPPGVEEALGNIKLSAQRAANLTRQLLRFGKRKEGQVRRTDLNERVLGVVDMLQRIVGEGVQLQLNLSHGPQITEADPDMIDQVLLNLVVNARDAVAGHGQIVIETFSVSEKEAGAIPRSAPGHYAGLRISDTGCGIPPEILSRIFEPFFTTKKDDAGTGLGLANVLEIVEQHHGFVKVASTIGQGSTFEVLFPASDSAGLPQADGPKREVSGGNETILVVEDDDSVRMSMCTALERRGYKVLEAADARAALEAWAGHERRVDLLLTDLAMPGGMSGVELAAQLRHCETRVRVIFMSGYCAEVALKGVELQPGQSFLQKPCSMTQLLRAVRQSLDEPLGIPSITVS
jgi:two-component system, cell cycle sensor histidine kinase and response regulator CckA